MSSGGGGGSVPANTSQTSTSEVILPDWVQSQVQQNIAAANNLAAQPYTAPPGPTLAGFTPDQLASFQAVRNMQGVAPGQIGSAEGRVANLPASTVSLLNPYLSRVEGDTTSNMLRASAAAKNQLNANAAATGAFGGDRNAVERATINSETQRNIGQAINQISATGWNTAMATALQQGATLGNLATAGQTASLRDAAALGQVGQTEQTLQQAQYSQALQQWQAAQNWPYQQLAIAQSALAGSPYGTTVQSSQPYNVNPAASYLGMISSAIPILSGLPQAADSLGRTVSQGAEPFYSLLGDMAPSGSYLYSAGQTYGLGAKSSIEDALGLVGA